MKDRVEVTDRETVVAKLLELTEDFVTERDWNRFHGPRDLAMCLSIEAAELLQLFLWVDPEQEGARPPPERRRLEDEMADVAICLFNLCNREQIDLSAAVVRKLAANAKKYPVSKARGSALKYSEYHE